MRKKPWEILPTTLNEPDAQQRMYALKSEYDKIWEQIQGLNNLLDGIHDERYSMLKKHPTLLLGRGPK